MLMLIPLLISLLFLMLMFFLNKTESHSFEEKLFFECGFDSIQSYRSLFSLRFFNISIIFLIFDMEVMFMLPLIFFFDFFKLIFFFIYLCLCFGLFLEWNQGGLSWK